MSTTTKYTVSIDPLNDERARITLPDEHTVWGGPPTAAPSRVETFEAYDKEYAVALGRGLTTGEAHHAAATAPSYVAAYERYRSVMR